MSQAVTVVSAANIAFIKYWGAVDLDAAVPCNPSISMTLDACRTRCTLGPHPDGSAATEDLVLYREGETDLAPATEAFAGRVRQHLGRLRARCGERDFVRVATTNSFPAAAGIASSASGFSALACAYDAWLGRDSGATELSICARLSGSGSASRSVMGGYVGWPAPDAPEHPAYPLHDAAHWDLADVVALVQTEPKRVSSLDGHRLAATSPYFEKRLAELPRRTEQLAGALAERDWTTFAEELEREAIDLHLIAISSTPPVFYWKPETLAVLERVRRLRDEGVAAASTMDAGANVHVICPRADAEAVAAALRALPGVARVIEDGVGGGPRRVDEPVG